MTEHKDHGDIEPTDAEDGKGMEPDGGHGAGERPLEPDDSHSALGGTAAGCSGLSQCPSGRRGRGEEYTTLVVTEPSVPILPEISSRWLIERAATLMTKQSSPVT
jgi:hypothetical protein